MRVHHVGYYVRDLEEARDTFAMLGFASVSKVVADNARKVDIQFLKNNTICIELISARGGATYFLKHFESRAVAPIMSVIPYPIWAEA